MSRQDARVRQSSAARQNGSVGKLFEKLGDGYTLVAKNDSEDEDVSLDGDVTRDSPYASRDAAYVYRHVIVFVFLVSIVASGIIVVTNAAYTANLERSTCRVEEYTLEKTSKLGRTDVELKRDGIGLCSVRGWDVSIHLRKGCSPDALATTEEKCVAELRVSEFGVFRNYRNLVTGRISHILTGANDSAKTSRVYLRLEDRGIALSRGKQPPAIDPQTFLTVEY